MLEASFHCGNCGNELLKKKKRFITFWNMEKLLLLCVFFHSWNIVCRLKKLGDVKFESSFKENNDESIDYFYNFNFIVQHLVMPSRFMGPQKVSITLLRAWEWWLKRSVSGLLADFSTCQHMVARQTNSSGTRHQHRPGALRWLQIVI